ncbi:MAG: hypothetical protein KA436_11235, partial [Oligoflexales bacterium]|nr:hypothetical protein [Oligoflexales bacterium]
FMTISKLKQADFQGDHLLIKLVFIFNKLTNKANTYRGPEQKKEKAETDKLKRAYPHAHMSCFPLSPQEKNKPRLFWLRRLQRRPALALIFNFIHQKVSQS